MTKRQIITILALFATSFESGETSVIVRALDTSYIYLGDYKDGGQNRLRALPKQFPGVGYTPDTCYATSKAHNYRFFGLQYGGECW